MRYSSRNVLHKPIKRYFVYILFIMIILTRGSMPLYFADGILVILGFFAIFHIRKKFWIDKSIVFVIVWMCSYSFINLLALNNVVNSRDLIISVVYFGIGFSIFLFLKNMLTQTNMIKEFIQIFILVVSVISILTIISHIAYVLFDIQSIFLYIRHGTARNAGLYGNPNYYSISLLLAIGFILGAFGFSPMNETNKKSYFILLLILSFDIILTYSRGALIAYILMIFIFSADTLKKNHSQFQISKKHIFYVCMNIVILILIIYLALNYFNNEFISGVFETLMERINNMFYGSGGGRYGIWNEGWYIFSENYSRILFGLGGNQFSHYSSFNQPTHNGFLKSLYENGVFGLGMLLFLLLYVSKSVYSILNHKIKSPIFYAVVGIVVMGLSNDVFILKEFWLVYSLATIYEAEKEK